MTADRARPYWLCLPALLLYGLLLAVPLAMTVLLSFNSYSDTKGVLQTWSLHNYADVVTDEYFHAIFLRTLAVALVTTVFCALIGVPEAWFLSRLRPRWRGLCLLVVLGPLLVSVVVRTLGWTILLGRDGLINQALIALHVVSSPVDLLFTVTGVVIALIHVMVPFMVIAAWTALGGVDPATENAAVSLGASQVIVFFRVVLPQIVPGVLSGLAGGWILAFVSSFDELTVTVFVSSPQVTPLPLRLFNHIAETTDPLVASVSAIIMGLTLVLLILLDRLYGVDRLFSGGRA